MHRDFYAAFEWILFAYVYISVKYISPASLIVSHGHIISANIYYGYFADSNAFHMSLLINIIVCVVECGGDIIKYFINIASIEAIVYLYFGFIFATIQNRKEINFWKNWLKIL